MTAEHPDTIISDLHRIREQMAAEFGGDLHALNADARARMEQSGRVIRKRRHPQPSATTAPIPRTDVTIESVVPRVPHAT